MKRRLLVVEDDASIRESLVDFFGDRDWLVTAAADAASATRAWRAAAGGESESFAVVLLDLALPDGDGLDLLRDARRAGDRTPVIVLTARGEVDQRVRGLKAGADDYVVKPFSVHELTARIDALLRRAGTPTATVQLGDANVDLAAHRVVGPDGSEHRLLAKEADLLAFLMRNRGTTFDREELLREVWGYDAAPTTRTVDTHVFNLRRKIEAEPRSPRLLVTVVGRGYRLEA